jgi:sarcosine oxidase subunit gamma
VRVEHARSPLAALEGDLALLGAREVAFLAQFAVRARPPMNVPALPTEPNTWTTDGERELLWLGPDEWLAVSETLPADELAYRLERAITDTAHALVDVSAARAVFELGGEHRLELLSAECGLDLHPRAWRPGVCAQTLLADVDALLQEREGATRVFVRPSFAAHVVRRLASAEVG